VDTRYLMPSTSGTTTGICCGRPLRRPFTASVCTFPTFIANGLKIRLVNHGGLR